MNVLSAARDRAKAAFLAARKPDLIERPEGDAPDAAPTIDANPILRRHLHTASTATTTWAFYRLDPVNWYGTSEAYRRAHIRSAAERYVELSTIGISRLWMRGVQWHYDADAFLARYGDTTRSTLTTWERETHLAAIGGMLDAHHCARPIAFLGVPITHRPTAAEHMPMLHVKTRTQDHLGLIEEARVRLGDITDILERPGLTAAPVTEDELTWMINRSVGLGLPEPTDGANPGTVEVVPNWMGDHLPMHRADKAASVHGATQVWRIESRPDEGDTDKRTPWLGWLSTAPVHLGAADGRRPVEIEWTSTIDLLTRSEAKKKVVRKEGQNRSIITDDTNRITRDQDRTLDRGEASADEVTTGSPVEALRAQQVTLIAVSVHGDDTERHDPTYDSDGHLVRAAGMKLASDAEHEQGAVLERKHGQYADYRLFLPGSDWGTLEEVGSVRYPTGLSLAAQVPAMTMKAGDPDGIPVGPIYGSRDFYTDDPWGGAKNNKSNAKAYVGDPGSGKTSFMVYRAKEIVNMYGRRVTFQSADPIIERMAEDPTLVGKTKVFRLGLDSKPGILSPGLLIPERPLSMFDGDEEAHAKAARADGLERRELWEELAIKSLPYSMQIHPDTASLIHHAVGEARGEEYGRHPREIIEAISNVKMDHAKRIAWELQDADEYIWAKSDIDEAQYGRAVGDDYLRLILTPLISPPAHGVEPQHWSKAEHRAVAVLTGAMRLAARDLWSDRELKALFSDEANTTTGGASSYGAFMTRVTTDNRKWGIDTEWIFHTAGALTRLADQILSLFSSVHAFRTDEENAAAILPLLRLPAGAGWESVIANLTSGEHLSRPWDTPAKVRHGYVTQAHWDAALKDVTYTTPAVASTDLTSASGIRC